MNDAVLLKNDDEVEEYINAALKPTVICFDETFDENNILVHFIKMNKISDILVFAGRKLKYRHENVKIFKAVNSKNAAYLKKNIMILIKPSDSFKNLQYITENLIKLKELADRAKIKLQFNKDNFIIPGFILCSNYDSSYIKSAAEALKAISMENTKQRYEYIYDAVCDDIDEIFIRNNYCDFKDGRCIAARKNLTPHEKNGCCYSFKYSKNPRKMIEEVKPCDKLNATVCSTKCMACKLYVCDYLKKQGISFDIQKIPLLNYFLSKKQHMVLKYNFFKTREEIIHKLMKTNTDKRNSVSFFLNNKFKIE